MSLLLDQMPGYYGVSDIALANIVTTKRGIIAHCNNVCPPIISLKKHRMIINMPVGTRFSNVCIISLSRYQEPSDRRWTDIDHRVGSEGLCYLCPCCQYAPFLTLTHDILHKAGSSLQWRHNGPDGVSNHHPRHRLLNRSFRRISKKTSKRVIGLCVEFTSDWRILRTYESYFANITNFLIWRFVKR